MARSPMPVESGTTFGTRIVIREVTGRPAPGNRVRRVMMCRCTGCGIEMEVLLQNLHTTGGCRACAGAARRGQAPTNKRHEMTRTTTHRIWKAMRRRCENSRDSGFARYGGRGIRVCERWGSFELFLADMGKRPSTAHSLDRIDNDGNYEPGNCRWATDAEQTHSKRNNVRLAVNGRAKTMAE